MTIQSNFLWKSDVLLRFCDDFVTVTLYSDGRVLNLPMRFKAVSPHHKTVTKYLQILCRCPPFTALARYMRLV